MGEGEQIGNSKSETNSNNQMAEMIKTEGCFEFAIFHDSSADNVDKNMRPPRSGFFPSVRVIRVIRD